jgi:hypothetical protein
VQQEPELRGLLRFASLHPLSRLEGLQEFRRELDELERELIRAALSVPEVTYEDIGRVLGISAAQASRRYRELAPESKRRRKRTTLPQSAARRRKAIDSVLPSADRYSELSAQRDLELEAEHDDEDEEGEEGAERG